jgi:Protein of unknown function (DUF2434)
VADNVLNDRSCPQRQHVVYPPSTLGAVELLIPSPPAQILSPRPSLWPKMPLIDARDLLAFPGGENVTDTLIGGVHFNKTILEYWNYTLYSNQTLSNGSWCILVFEPYSPVRVYPNGTFLNATWCYEALNPIGPRAATGIGFAVAFGFMLLLTLINLRKHASGRLGGDGNGTGPSACARVPS